jgi:hypothetical protein
VEAGLRIADEGLDTLLKQAKEEVYGAA